MNQAEMEYIRQGGGLAETAGTVKTLNLAHLRHLFNHRQLWGIYIGQFANTSTLFFFLTWFPTYLVSAKHMQFLKAGFLGSIPYIAAFLGVIFSGYLSDRMLRRGFSTGASRKTPIITGLLLACAIILANYTTSTSMIITIMSVAFFAQGMSAISWTLVSDIAPSELVGLAGGVFNFMGNLAGIVTPLVVGIIVNATHSFSGALVFISVVALIGALSYIFIAGKIQRIEINE
ncbi:MFS transporter [Fodinisporobacter ferrooxydans]|uniref:MFS transporter n=1 Tax=Fodinisporobacter ferrooxydans TaxID=2901836 RepID=A0ABY4CTK5_9BACL|nr:MFS transporter [Alicyclobacillaceae bacterium MYW30-H2]